MLDSAFDAAIVTCYTGGAGLVLIGVGHRLAAERSARSPELLKTIELRQEADETYTPDDWLLSDRGRLLRRRGTRLMKVGFLGIACAILIFASSRLYHTVVALP